MKNRTRIMPLTLLLLAALPLLLLSCAPPSTGNPSTPSTPSPPNDWRIGSDVRLCQGTQIREGPGLGFCYHTIVPENNWVVRVTGGPQTSDDGKIWYDTSRRAAGDPSGGTGWVNIQQTAACPAPDEGGTRCPYSVQPTPTPTTIIDIDDNIVERILKTLDPLLSWWLGQPLPVKIGVVIVAILLIPTTRRLNVVGGTALGDIARAILLGIALGGIADLTRPYWQDAWIALVGGTTGFDLAILLLIAPLLWWALGFVSRIASRAIGVAVLIILLLLLLAFIAPDRLEALLDAISGVRK